MIKILKNMQCRGIGVEVKRRGREGVSGKR